QGARRRYPRRRGSPALRARRGEHRVRRHGQHAVDGVGRIAGLDVERIELRQRIVELRLVGEPLVDRAAHPHRQPLGHDRLVRVWWVEAELGRRDARARAYGRQGGDCVGRRGGGIRRADAAADPQDRVAVLEFVIRYFPAQFDFITKQLDAFRASAVSVGVAGTIALVWGALGVFGAISTAVNYAWGVEKQRSFWKHKLFSFVMLLVAGLILLIALLLISASQVVGASWFAEVLARFPGLGFLRGFTIRHATTLLFILVVGLVYYVVPNAKVRFRDVW